MNSLVQRVREGGLFQGYAYGYPHKMAYRPLSPAVPLTEAWRGEDTGALFLYAHVPFCEARCGFCNLFTTTGQAAAPDRVNAYLDALERQAGRVGEALGRDARVSRVAIGGGTPTFLTVPELERLFRILNGFPRPAGAPIAIEMSPETAEPGKLRWLRDMAGVTRASLGVQSFIEAETRALGRPQNLERVKSALQAMRAAGFPIRNIDLIYGMEGQDWASWRQSLECAIHFEPEEVFLYPLYVRALTGLGRKNRWPTDHRDELYRRGRDWLLERGYRQISMRLFRAAHHPGDCGVHYCCQEDGMVGLGAGARSYTRHLHYSSEWAVGQTGVREILDHYIQLPDRDHGVATYGVRLTEAEERRRYVIKSLLRTDGLDLAAYEARFHSRPMQDFPILTELLEGGAATLSDKRLAPTQLGLEWSDVIGPWLYSAEVVALMEDFSLR